MTLIASDDTGSATLDATLVVSRDSSPSLEVPINEQIPPFGTFSGPSSILAPPDAPFSFQVFSDTFSNPSNHPLNYYAVTLDHTPLPAWVIFDPTTLSFSGRTPPFESLIQPPQAFGLQLIASDVEGFSAASLEFTIVVGADTHQITSTQTVVVLNVTAGEPILYANLRDDVKVDSQPATPENSIIKSLANPPEWLTLDPTSWRITGTPPKTADSTNFTVTLGDKFSNTLNITFVLEVSGQTHSLLNKQIPIVDITPGEEFSFDLAPFLTNPEDTEISVPVDLPSWIQINPDTKIISGLVPLTLTPTDPAVELTIDLKSKTSSATDSTQLTFSIADTTPSASSTIIAQPSASSNSIKAPANDDQGSNSPALPVNTKLLAILLPILLLVIALMILFIWWFRRRRTEQQEQPRLMTREISEPLPGSFVVTGHGLPESESHRELEEQRSGRTHSARNGTFAAGALATAVGDHEKKDPIESREIYQTTEGELMVRPLSTVRLIPSTERLRTAASNFLAKGRAASLGSRSAVSSRRGRPTRGNSTLSSISETTSHLLDGSLGMEVAHPGGPYLDLPKHHTNSASSFRGDIEINIPALRDPSAPPESTYTDDESNWTDAPYASSPPGSSQGNSPRYPLASDDRSCEAPDVMTIRLRTASRQGHYPAAPTQKFSWPWNKKNAAGSVRTSRVSFFSRTGRINSNSAGMRHTSQQASLRSIPSVDTCAQRKEPNSRGNKPPAMNSPSHDRDDSNTTAGISFSGISFPRTPTLPELPRLPSLLRSPTRNGPGEDPVTDDADDDDKGSVRSSIIRGTITTTTTTATGKETTHTTGRKRAATFGTGRDSIYTANDSVPGGEHRTSSRKKKSFIPDHSVWTATKGHSHDSLGIIYSDLVKNAPFHPSSSAFWSSPASRRGKEKESAADNSSGILPPNWALLDRDRDSSPAPSHAIKGWGASSNLGVGEEDPDGESVFGGTSASAANKKLQAELVGSLMKSPRIGISEAKIGSGGLRLVEPSSSIRGPPSEAGGVDPDVMSINTVDYWKGRAGAGAGAPSTAGPGSSVMSIPRDMTPDRIHDSSYWNKLGLGGKMFSRGDREGVSWTADLGKHDRGTSSRIKKSRASRGKGRGAGGSLSRFSMISEGNGKEGAMEKDKDNGKEKEKEKDAAAAVSLASASKSSVGGSHYYI